jgi:ribosomal protein L10
MVARSKKIAYFAHLEECLNKYARAFLVDADFVGSKQISDIRIALRGKAELVFGKNTMIRRCLRNLTEDGSHPEWEGLIPIMVGNIGFVFTNGSLADLEDVIKEYVKPAAAKAGVIAPCDCTIPKGPTGLDPAQTSFFQALNIGTKINKGSIEIINDCQVITEGTKVRLPSPPLRTAHHPCLRHFGSACGGGHARVGNQIRACAIPYARAAESGATAHSPLEPCGELAPPNARRAAVWAETLPRSPAVRAPPPATIVARSRAEWIATRR